MARSSRTECWVGLVFALAGARDEWHQGQVDVDGVAARQIVAHLPDGFEIRQAFDIADGAADLAQHEIKTLVAVADKILNRVGDVGNDLDGVLR